MRHIADRINMDQQTDAGDDHQPHGGEPVEGEIDADIQRAGLDPGVVMFYP